MPKLLALFFLIILILLVIYIAKLTYKRSEGIQGAAEVIVHRLADSPERIAYRHDVKHDNLPTLHDGQRKLLLSEIEFLTKYGHLAKKVVYVGAAMGRHLLVLHELFPNHKFILYDPNPFYEGLHNHKSFEIHNDFFTDDDVKKYKKQSILFISDIRSQDHADDAKLFEQSIVEDMARQRRWVEQMKPKASSLKFRLPFTPGITEYLGGDIYIQSYPPKFSAECRLFVPEKKIKELQKYDHTEHEERMWYHNNISRPCYYPHDVDYPGLDYCYDCASQVQIIKDYLGSKHAKQAKLDKLTPKDILEKIDPLAKPLTRDNHGERIDEEACKQKQASRKLLIQTTRPRAASIENNKLKSMSLYF